jgi:hypothetical protein
MPRTTVDDDWEGEDDDWQPVEDDDWQPDEDEEDDDTVSCPHCHQPVYEGAEQCPNCGVYLSEEDKPAESKPPWIIVGGLICVVIVILWVWKG